MKHTTRPLLPALAFSIIAPLAQAQSCQEPSFTATIPDGSETSQEQMDAVYAKVTEFVKQGESYIACIEESSSRSQAQRLRNQMLDEMEKIAAQFNRQLRIFRRANA